MTAILEEEILTRAPITQMSEQGAELTATAAGQSSTGEALKAMMPELVKGAGFAHKGGNQPLSDSRDITLRASQAVIDIRHETARGFSGQARNALLTKGANSGFLNQFGALRTALSTPSIGEQIVQIFQNLPGGAEALAKSFTAGNLGIGSVSGFVPFDLLAPSRLIYPVYTVNKAASRSDPRRSPRCPGNPA
jgi:hypothetical protein